MKSVIGNALKKAEDTKKGPEVGTGHAEKVKKELTTQGGQPDVELEKVSTDPKTDPKTLRVELDYVAAMLHMTMDITTALVKENQQLKYYIALLMKGHIAANSDKIAAMRQGQIQTPQAPQAPIVPQGSQNQ